MQHVGFLQDKMKVLWYTWLANLVLSFCYSISAIVAAAQSESKAYSFDVIWLMLVIIAFAVAGTYVLRRISLRTPLSIGVIIGASFMLCSHCLSVAVNSGGNFARFGSPSVYASEEAVQAFCIMLIMVYALLCFLVMRSRDVLLPAPPMASQDNLPASASTSIYEGNIGGAGVVTGVDAVKVDMASSASAVL